MTYGWLGWALNVPLLSNLSRSLRSINPCVREKNLLALTGRAARLKERNPQSLSFPASSLRLLSSPAPLVFPVSLASIGRHCASVLALLHRAYDQHETI